MNLFDYLLAEFNEYGSGDTPGDFVDFAKQQMRDNPPLTYSHDNGLTMMLADKTSVSMLDVESGSETQGVGVEVTGKDPRFQPRNSMQVNDTSIGVTGIK